MDTLDPLLLLKILDCAQDILLKPELVCKAWREAIYARSGPTSYQFPTLGYPRLVKPFEHLVDLFLEHLNQNDDAWIERCIQERPQLVILMINNLKYNEKYGWVPNWERRDLSDVLVQRRAIDLFKKVLQLKIEKLDRDFFIDNKFGTYDFIRPVLLHNLAHGFHVEKSGCTTCAIRPGCHRGSSWKQIVKHDDVEILEKYLDSAYNDQPYTITVPMILQIFLHNAQKCWQIIKAKQPPIYDKCPRRYVTAHVVSLELSVDVKLIFLKQASPEAICFAMQEQFFGNVRLFKHIDHQGVAKLWLDLYADKLSLQSQKHVWHRYYKNYPHLKV